MKKGQIVIILLLVVVVTLAIGLSIVGRSVSEISTSTKSEDSSRAFSAAEAGVERALQETSSLSSSSLTTSINVPSGTLGNQANALVNLNYGYPAPCTPQPCTGGIIEYPPFGKESFGQVWLADPNSLASSYTAQSFDFYLGNPSPNGDSSYYSTHPDDKPAAEVDVITDSSGTYQANKFYYDSSSSRTGGNGNNFTLCPLFSGTVTTNYGSGRTFYCKVTVTYSCASPCYPVMIRVRMLYSSLSQPMAVGPSPNYNLPPQVNMYTSTGTVGNIQRTVQVFRQTSVLPQFLDYVLFSSGSISK